MALEKIVHPLGIPIGPQDLCAIAPPQYPTPVPNSLKLTELDSSSEEGEKQQKPAERHEGAAHL